MTIVIEVEQEIDGRWIAEAMNLPGVMTYGASQAEAIANAKKLAASVLADRMDHGERTMPG